MAKSDNWTGYTRVRDLIEMLQKQDPDALVFTADSDDADSGEVNNTVNGVWNPLKDPPEDAQDFAKDAEPGESTDPNDYLPEWYESFKDQDMKLVILITDHKRLDLGAAFE